MWNRNTHVGFFARHFRAAGKPHSNQSTFATASAALPLKGVGRLSGLLTPLWTRAAMRRRSGTERSERAIPQTRPLRLREC